MSEPRIINLWPEGHPFNQETLGVLPRLEVYTPETPAKGPFAVIIICPGGAYRHRAYHEGEPVAQLLADHGIVGAVLQYRVAPHDFPAPQIDACRAVRLVRSMASELNIDPDRVGMMGFSAGGHLTAMTGVLPNFAKFDDDPLATYDARPNRIILAYAVLSFERAYLAKEDQNNNSMPDEARTIFSPLKHVNVDTPPTFLFHTADDERVPVRNSISFTAACAANGVPVEAHIYPHGLHGLGLAKDDPILASWPSLLLDWLSDWR